ncbi:unnamed protein product [Closterium sp. NIES-54]
MVHNTCDKLRQQYIEHGVNYAEDSELLTEFLDKHGPLNKREVTAKGMDGEGSPVTHTFMLHEDAIKGQKSKGDIESCITVTSRFAQEVVKHLLKWMESLDTLSGAKLFLPDAYAEGSAKRDRLCAAWFQSLRELFSAEKCVLPGVSWKKAGRELATFTKMMASQYKDQTFHAGLKHMLRSEDWEMSYPNMVCIWIALAVLPLSTVECERGFSRQNIIKSWLRGNLCNTRLADLMSVSLMQYEPNWDEVVAAWRGAKKRRPAEEVTTKCTPERAPKRKAERGTSAAASNEDEDDEDVVRRRTSKKLKACAAVAVSDDSDDDYNGLDVRATVALDSDTE